MEGHLKRLVALTLVFLLLVSVTTAYGAAPGSAGDPLVSQNFLSGSYLQSVKSEISAQASSSMATTYGAAGSRLKAAYDAAMARLGAMSGYSFAPSFRAVNLPIGAIVTLVTGSTVILVSGTAALTVRGGTVVNISTGQEEASGISLTAGQRYFCAEDTTAVVTTSSDAVCALDGYYTTTGAVVQNAMPFLDVRNTDWFYGAVSYVTGKNLFTGTSPATFAPLDSMTRGMFVTVLYRLAGKPGVAAASVFPDVSDAAQYYYAPVVWG